VTPLAERTQLTGNETLTLLLQLIRLIRRFRLEDAYLAQVVDVNAVLGQRVGHLLESRDWHHVTRLQLVRGIAAPRGTLDTSRSIVDPPPRSARLCAVKVRAALDDDVRKMERSGDTSAVGRAALSPAQR